MKVSLWVPLLLRSFLCSRTYHGLCSLGSQLLLLSYLCYEHPMMATVLDYERGAFSRPPSISLSQDVRLCAQSRSFISWRWEGPSAVCFGDGATADIFGRRWMDAACLAREAVVTIARYDAE